MSGWTIAYLVVYALVCGPVAVRLYSLWVRLIWRWLP